MADSIETLNLPAKNRSLVPLEAKVIFRPVFHKGKKRLEQLLDLDFQPVFTPPWNRCSSDTLEALADLGFKAVSRSRGARPETLPHLPDFQVNVDLHTRKEAEPHRALKNLITEIEQGLASGLCGIMIHHQRMNGAALELLDILLSAIKNNQFLLPVHFGDLLKMRLS